MPWQQKETLTLIIAVTILLVLLTSFMALTIVVYNKRKRKHLLEKEIRERSFNQTLLQSQLEIQEQTFKNISQEIHDNIGQALTLAKLNLNTLGAELGEVPMQKVITTKEIISKAISDLRDLSRSLNTDYIADMGLQKALAYELGLISKSTSIKTELQTTGEPFRMDNQKELILFRMVQEALNNTIKHAWATIIQATINYSSDKLELTLSDDGKGFEIAEQTTDNGAGLGLRNMQNRAKLIAAEFSISSSAENGTIVKIVIPNHTASQNKNQ